MKKNQKSNPSNAKSKKTLANDKARLDLVRHKDYSSFGKHDKVHDPFDDDSKALQLQNLIERHKIDQASRAVNKVKATKKKAKFAEIKQKIDDGFYDNPNQLAELAEKLIKRFGLE